MATEADARAIARLYGHYVLTSPATFETEPPDEAEMRHRIHRVTPMFPWLVVEGAEGVEGYAYAWWHRERPAYQWSVDVSAYVQFNCRGRGVGGRLYVALLEILRRQGFYIACAGITLPNAGSVGLHKSVGFELVGVYSKVGYKLGEWHDTSWWQLELAPRPHEPSLPVSWRELDLSDFEIEIGG